MIALKNIHADTTGAILLTSDLNGAPIGTANLVQGNKYVITLSGIVITWIGETITVCEPGLTRTDIWSIAGAPPILTNGASQTINYRGSRSCRLLNLKYLTSDLSDPLKQLLLLKKCLFLLVVIVQERLQPCRH